MMKKNSIKVLKRYRFFLIMFGISLGMLIYNRIFGIEVYRIAFSSIMEMLGILPPIFILIGLLDVWVEKETMVKYMGEKSGIIGVLLAFFLGSVAAGPLYVSFPIAGIFIKKGSKLSNVFIIVGAWATMKIPMLLFEIASMGPRFTVIRLVLDIIVVLIIAYSMEYLLTEKDRQEIYELVEKID